MLASCSFMLVNAGCRREEKPLTVVETQPITIAEFVERYKTHIANARIRDNLVVRKQVLDNMINERLIFRDIERRRLDENPVLQRRKEEIRNQALLDAYAKKIAGDSVRITDDELKAEFERYSSKVAVRYLYAADENEIRRLKKSIEEGATTFSAEAAKLFTDPGLASNGGYLGYIGWGEMERSLEDAAFHTGVGNISEPFRLNMGYAILKVEDRRSLPLASETDFAKVRQLLERTLTELKSSRAIELTARRIAEELRAEFHEETVRKLFEQWNDVSGDIRHFEGAVVHEPDEMSTVVVFMSREKWTAGDVVKRFAALTPKQRKRVRERSDIESIILGLKTREVLLSRARAQGFTADSLVRQQVRYLTEELWLNAWAANVQDSVGRSGWVEDTLMAYYEHHRARFMEPPEVNVAEILTRTRPVADSLRALLDRGKDFAELARKHSIRRWSAERGGELGFGTESTFGVLGPKFFRMDVGDLTGPEFVDPYFGLFKVIEKKEGRRLTFGESRPAIIEELAAVRKRKAFSDAVASLRSAADVSVDADLLANISLQ